MARTTRPVSTQGGLERGGFEATPPAKQLVAINIIVSDDVLGGACQAPAVLMYCKALCNDAHV